MPTIEIERHPPSIDALLARAAEADRRLETLGAEQDRRLAACLELVRRMPGGRA